jgi:hypothetical protein
VTCCPGHDPIIAAGWINCGNCRSRSYPAAAEWLTDAIVIATFGTTHNPGCPDPAEFGTILLDTTTGGLVPRVQRPGRCRAIAASTGQPCRGYVRPGSGYCHTHQPPKGVRDDMGQAL